MGGLQMRVNNIVLGPDMLMSDHDVEDVGAGQGAAGDQDNGEGSQVAVSLAVSAHLFFAGQKTKSSAVFSFAFLLQAHEALLSSLLSIYLFLDQTDLWNV